MNLVFSKKIAALLCSLFAAVLLFWAISAGLETGKNLAGSELILKNTATLKQALTFFYQDQNRYPTPLEFNNTDIMLNYLSAFPPAQVLTGGCTDSFAYKRLTLASFQLSFCLPKPIQGLHAGWNKINEQKR